MDGNMKSSSSSISDHSNNKKSAEDTISTSSTDPAPFRYVFKHEEDELDVHRNLENTLEEDITTPSEVSQELNFDDSFPITNNSASKVTVSPLYENQSFVLSSPSKNDSKYNYEMNKMTDDNPSKTQMLTAKTKGKPLNLASEDQQNEDSYHQSSPDIEKMVTELKLQITKKDSEIERLYVIEKNFKQNKQILKDTTWALRVKEEELLSIKTEMRENYEKRLRELMQRLNDQEYQMGELQSQNNELIEKENDSILRVDELNQQIYLLTQELEMKNKLAHVIEKEKELTAGENKSQIKILSQQVQELSFLLEKSEKNYGKESLRLQELELQIENFQTNTAHLETLVEQKDSQLKLLEESKQVIVQNLQDELFKSKSQIKELVLLLEGASTNSDIIPTRQIDETDFNVKHKKLSNFETDGDSFGSVDDIQSEDLLSHIDNDSVKQMNHTIGKYEQQIIDLQNLYDHDISQLFAEKEEVLKELQELKVVLNKEKQSKETSSFEHGQLQDGYEAEIEIMKKNFESTLDQQKTSLSKTISQLQNENEKLQLLLHQVQKKYDDAVAGLEIAQEQTNLTADKYSIDHDSVAEIEQLLQQQINEIKSQYDKQLTSLETDFHREKQIKNNELENNFSSQFFLLQEENIGLTKKISSLESELDVVQQEYDDLKIRYDLINAENEKSKKKIEMLQDTMKSNDVENTVNYNNFSEMFNKNNENLNSLLFNNGINDRETASDNDVLAKSSALHLELIRLRENFNDAKVEVENLRSERNKFASLSDALSQNLQELQIELELNNNKSLLPDLNSTIKEVDMLRHENSLLVHKLNLSTPLGSLPGYSSEHMIEEVTLQPLLIESKPIDSGYFNNIKEIDNEQEEEITIFDQIENLNFIISEKTEHEKELLQEIEKLNCQIESYQSSSEENKIIELQSQLERSEQLSNHLQEMFSIQLMKLQEENKQLTNDILVFKQKLEKQKKLSEEKKQLELLLESEKVLASESSERLQSLQQKLQEEQAAFMNLNNDLSNANKEIEIECQNNKKALSENMQYQLELAETKEELIKSNNELIKLKATINQKNDKIDQLTEEIKTINLAFKEREDAMKLEFEDTLRSSKEAMSVTNSECLSRLRSELDIDHQQRLKASEDMLHDEYTKRIKALSEIKEAELVNLKSEYEAQLSAFTTSFTAEKEKQIRTLKTVLERNHLKEIQELLVQHDNKIEALQKQYSEETEKLVAKLHSNYTDKITELETALGAARVEQFEALKLENNKLIEKELEMLSNSLNEKHSNEIISLEHQHKKEMDDIATKHKKEIDDIATTHKKEMDNIAARYEKEYEIRLSQKTEELVLNYQNQLNFEKKNLNLFFETKLSSELEKAALELNNKHLQSLKEYDSDLQIKHQANINKILLDIQVEHDNYVKARVDEITSQNNMNIQTLEENLASSLAKYKFEMDEKMNDLKTDHSKTLMDLTNLFEEKKLELFETKKILEAKVEEIDVLHQNNDLVVDKFKKSEENYEAKIKDLENLFDIKLKSTVAETVTFYEGLMEKKVEETENNDNWLFAKRIEEKDLEIKKLHNEIEELIVKNENFLTLHNFSEEKIKTLQLLYDELRLGKDMEILSLTEQVEERKKVEDELRLKIDKMKQKNEFKLNEIKNLHEQNLEHALKDQEITLNKAHENQINNLVTNHNQEIEQLMSAQKEEILTLGKKKELNIIGSLAEMHTKLVLKHAVEIEKFNFDAKNLLDKTTCKYQNQINEMLSTVELLKAENNKLISQQLTVKLDQNTMTEEDLIVVKLKLEITNLQLQLLEATSQFQKDKLEDAKKIKNVFKKTQKDFEIARVSYKQEIDKLKLEYDWQIKKVGKEIICLLKDQLKVISNEKEKEFEMARDDLIEQQQNLLNEFVKHQEYEIAHLQHDHDHEVQELKSKLQAAEEAMSKVAAVITTDISTCTDEDRPHDEEFSMKIAEVERTLTAKFQMDNAVIEEKYKNQLFEVELKQISDLREVEESLLNKHLKNLTELKEEMEHKHSQKIQELERIVEEKVEEQHQLLLESQKHHALDIDSINQKHALMFQDLTEKHNRLLQSIQEEFQQKNTEQITAVVASMELEKDRIKDELLAVHEQELDDLKKDIEQLTLKLIAQEKQAQDLKKENEEYHETIHKKHQVDLMQLRESLEDEHQKERINLENSFDEKIRTENDEIMIIQERFNIEKKQLLDELIKKDNLIKQLHEDQTEKYELEHRKIEEKIKLLEKDIVHLEREKLQLRQTIEVKGKEIDQLNANVKELISKNELMFERHDRQEQESSNLVAILQNDVNKLTKERYNLAGLHQQLRKSLSNLLAGILHSEDNIHKKLDEMIVSNLSSLILPEDLLNIRNGHDLANTRNGEKSTNTTLALQNDITNVEEVSIDPDHAVHSLVPDEEESIIDHADFKVNIQDPEELKEIGERLFMVVDHLLDMFSSTVNELSDIRIVCSETQNNVNVLSHDLEIKKDQLLNLENENKHITQQIYDYDSQVKDLKLNLSKLNEQNNQAQIELAATIEKNNLIQTDHKNLMEYNSLLENQLKQVQTELNDSDNRVEESSKVILSVQQNNQKLEKESQECKEKLKEKELELILVCEKLTSLQLENKLAETKLSDLQAENKQLMDEKNAKEIKFANLKMELENERYSRKQEEFAFSKKATKAAFVIDEEKENLKQEIESLKEIIKEIMEEKQELRSQMLDSGYSHKEDSLRSDMTKVMNENDELILNNQKLLQQVCQLEGALQETLYEKQKIESTLNEMYQVQLSTKVIKQNQGKSIDFNVEANAIKTPIKDIPSSIVGSFQKGIQSTAVSEQKMPSFTHGSPIPMHQLNHNLNSVRFADEIQTIRPDSSVLTNEDFHSLTNEDVQSLNQMCELVNNINNNLCSNEGMPLMELTIEPPKNEVVMRLKEMISELFKKISDLSVNHARMAQLSLQQKEDIEKFSDLVSQLSKEKKDLEEIALVLQDENKRTVENLMERLASSENDMELFKKDAENLAKKNDSMKDELCTMEEQATQNATLIKDLEAIIRERDQEIKAASLKHNDFHQQRELYNQQRVYVAELEACLKETQFVLSSKNEELKLMKSWSNEKRIEEEMKSCSDKKSDEEQKPSDVKENVFEMQNLFSNSQLVNETKNDSFWHECTDNQMVNKTVHQRLMNLLKHQQQLQDETIKNLTDKDVKLLVNDIQNEAEEVLNLVMSIPELNEALSSQNMQHLQNAWLIEKNCLLAVINSLKDLVVKAASGKYDGDRRLELVNALADLFEKEQEAISVECKINGKDKEKQFDNEISPLLTTLLSKDREMLVDEVKRLRSVTSADNSFVLLNKQIDELKCEITRLNTQLDYLNSNLEAEKLAKKQLSLENSDKFDTLKVLTTQLLQYQQSNNEARLLLEEEVAKSNHLRKLLEDAESNVVSLHDLVKSERESLNNLLEQDSCSVNELEKMLDNEMEKRALCEEKLANLKVLLENEKLKVQAFETELNNQRENRFNSEKLVQTQKLKIAELEKQSCELETKLLQNSDHRKSFQKSNDLSESLQNDSGNFNNPKLIKDDYTDNLLKDKILSLEKININLQEQLERGSTTLNTYEKKIDLLKKKLSENESILSVKEAQLEKSYIESSQNNIKFDKIIKLNEFEVRKLNDEITQLRKSEEYFRLALSALEKDKCLVLEKANVDLSSQLESNVFTLNTHEKHIELLKNKLTESESVLSEKEAELEKSYLELQKYKNKLTKSESVLSEKEAELEKSYLELQKYKNKLTESESVLSEKEAELEKSYLELQKYKNKLTKSESVLSEKEAELEKSYLELQKYKNKLTESESILSVKNAEIKKSYVELHQQRNEFDKIKISNESEVRKLEDIIRQLRKSEDKYNLVSGALEKEWSTKNNALSLRENLLNEKEAELEKLILELEKENNLLLEKRKHQENTEQESIKKKSEIDRLAEELKEKMNKNSYEINADKSSQDFINLERDQLLENIHRLEHKVAFYRQQDVKFQELRDFWEKERDHMRAQFEQIKLQRDKFKEKGHKLSAKIIQLKEKMFFLQKTTDENNQMHLIENNKLQDEITILKERLASAPLEVAGDGLKLLNAGWTIAKVQRLYLKYFRAESFRKALSYQKTYLLLLLSEYGNSNQSLVRKMVRENSSTPYKKFKVTALVIVSIARMKFLKRKYQRSLYKSSADYPYKDVREKKHDHKDNNQSKLLLDKKFKPEKVSHSGTISSPSYTRTNPVTIDSDKQYFNKTSSDEKMITSQSLNYKSDSHDHTLSKYSVTRLEERPKQSTTDDLESSIENNNLLKSPSNISNTSPCSDSNASNTPRFVEVSVNSIKSSILNQSRTSSGLKHYSDAPRSYPRPSPTQSDFVFRHASPPVRDVDDGNDGKNIYSPQTISINKEFADVYTRGNRDSSTSLNHYIQKLESLQVRLKEQHTQFDKSKRSLNL
ncbi:golgin subfamily B member 1 isoform X2 [Hydra vulgaris]|uniref:golgin subfamily B member 1 isoform X2 n=1 Tax=Hydra vulgaris TaxID=6087 RepID=UPI001F5E3BEE|nr:golgin subfamily B member 1 isoform X2 [Hydra vulgaris]